MFRPPLTHLKSISYNEKRDIFTEKRDIFTEEKGHFYGEKGHFYGRKGTFLRSFSVKGQFYGRVLFERTNPRKIIENIRFCAKKR